VVSDSLPLGLTFVSASANGKVTNSIVTWPKIKSLKVGGVTNFTLTVKVTNPGTFTNLASALAATHDPNPANNSGVQSQVIAGGIAFGFQRGKPTLNPQTGLFEETVTVTNTGNNLILGFRLFVHGLRNGVKLWNADGTTNGVPFVNYNFSLNPSATATLVLELYSPHRTSVANTLTAQAIVPASTSTSGTDGSVPARMLPPDTRIEGDTRYIIEFPSVPGKTYVILYTSDLGAENWNVATPSVKASSTITQWYDDGPPKTESKPESVGSRFYRVIQY
jgi:hypothetical protein